MEKFELSQEAYDQRQGTEHVGWDGRGSEGASGNVCGEKPGRRDRTITGRSVVRHRVWEDGGRGEVDYGDVREQDSS